MHPVLFKIGAILIPSYGALAAIGVLAALLLAQRTARTARVSPQSVWNVCVVALCAALVGSRLLLVAANWRELLHHPQWLLGLSMIHNPWVAAAGALAGAGAAWLYARSAQMPMLATLDALAAPVVLGGACEQLGALLAGSGYGTETNVPWAVTYTSVLAARWSGTPLGMALHPVQAYAAMGLLTLAVFLLTALPRLRQAGDAAGVALMGSGAMLFVTELWRDPEGRGTLLGGALDVPQIGSIVMVLGGALLLRERAGASRAVVHEADGALDRPDGEAHHA